MRLLETCHRFRLLTILLSKVRFGSFLVYTPRGTSGISAKSRTVCYDLKRAKAATLQRMGELLLRHIEQEGELLSILGGDTVLVPVPRSSPIPKGALWPAGRICDTLIEYGLAQESIPCLERIEAVPKSAYAAPGERPSAQKHYDTLAVSQALIQPSRITLIDDVVTRGRTLLAAATRISEAFPGTEVRALAIVRTMGFVSDLEKIVEPCVGLLSFKNGDVDRTP